MPEQDHRVGRRADYDAKKREAAARMRLEEGLTQQQIAERLGVSRGRIGKYLRDMGIRGAPANRSSPRRRDRLRLLHYASEAWDVMAREFELNELLDRYERAVAAAEQTGGNEPARDERSDGASQHD